MPDIQVNNTTLHYDERGQGVPLVLIHGFPLTNRMWHEQLDALSDRYRVIAPDLRGFGKSKLGASFTLQSLADDVHELLRKLDALPCVLAGLSMGGYVALPFVRRYAADLHGLMLVDTRAEGDSAEAKAKRDGMINMVRDKGSNAVADAMIPNLLAPSNRAAIEPALRAIIEVNSSETIEAALAAIRDREDFTAFLPRIKVPTVVVCGKEDAITPPAVSEAMHRAIPGSSLAIIEGAGHMSPMERPNQVNHAMRSFLQSLRI